MKILFAHNDTRLEVTEKYKEIATLAPPGLTVLTFAMGPKLKWEELNEQWRQRDPGLLRLYRKLVLAAKEADVLLLYNGTNLHPEVLPCLPTFNIYCYFDDPESSAWGSAPVANKFDAVFHGNISSVFQYQHWGCKKLAFLPMLTAASSVPPKDAAVMLGGERRNDIVFVGEMNKWRSQRLSMLAQAFPQAQCFGRGWPKGKATVEQQRELYLASKVGWNVHNSTGPINLRLYSLAAHGVLQICDNKTGLGQIYRLGEEVVGFDTIPEAIELTTYYLEHEKERKAIVEKAYERYWKDYSASAIWARIAKQLEAWGTERKQPTATLPKRSWLGFTLHPRKKASQAMPAAATEKGLSRPTAALFTEAAYVASCRAAYTENPALPQDGSCREKQGEWERPSMLALSWAVTSLLGEAKSILQLSFGSGTFAAFAGLDPGRRVFCVEADDCVRALAMERWTRSNTRYLKTIEECAEQQFDVLVVLEVIQRLPKVHAYLERCKKLAPKAIVSTPNRIALRGPEDSGPPPDKSHVREFDTGEFYWLLRQYYEKINLYYQPDMHVPWLAPMTIAMQGTPIIAQCSA